MKSITLDVMSFEFGVSVFLLVWIGAAILELIYVLINYFSKRKLLHDLHRVVKGFVESYNSGYSEKACIYGSVPYFENLLMLEMLDYFGYEMCSDGQIRRFTRWEKIKKRLKETIRNNQQRQRIDS